MAQFFKQMEMKYEMICDRRRMNVTEEITLGSEIRLHSVYLVAHLLLLLFLTLLKWKY